MRKYICPAVLTLMPRFLASVLSSVPVYAFDNDVTAVDVALAKFSEAEDLEMELQRGKITIK
jgi:hypothetical protein